MSGELLLELLTEEIPARMQRRAIDDLTGLIGGKLAGADIPAASIEGHVTPRRLVVIADGIPARQPDRSEERRGPRVGAPQQAIDGFLRAAGLVSIDQCEVRGTDRGEFYFAVLNQPGRATAEVLPELIHAAMAALPWPKSMRYPASPLRWVRPLNSAVCLFDGAVLTLPLGDVPVGRVTRGHRFLSPGEISVGDAADYRDKLAKAHVVLDWSDRRAIIAQGLDKLAKAEGLAVKPDEALLDEVTGLVEYPVPLMGTIDADFVRPLPDGLPSEVLATAMRTHQKYFSCLNPDGAPAPRFLFVANNLTPDAGKTIAAGNERVLRARLSDARFFWDQDRKIRLEDRVEALKQRVYHEKLGSVYDKVERMESLATYLAETLAPQFVAPAKAGAQGQPIQPSLLDSRLRGNDDREEFKTRCVRAAHLAKADLSTGMVGEFPELQGVMGRYYSHNDGEDPRAADAIADHYKPIGPGDTCPNAPVSIVAALADKLDALVAFFAVGEKPTGSGDPYALRRAAQGVIRLILENELRLPLRSVFSFAHRVVRPGAVDAEIAEAMGELIGFVFDRLRVHVREQGISHDLIEAARRVGQVVRLTGSRSVSQEDDLTRFMRRVRALRQFLVSEDGSNLLTGYRRAANIVAIEERKDGPHNGAVDRHLFTLSEETALERALRWVSDDTGKALGGEKFEEAMSALAVLRQPVDEFFERVTVNVDDPKLRENRLRLLARIRATMNQVADFSQIEG
jgi:glycyl-tRNA synthetase beta chain